MTFTELINKINQFIIANNNREITADVLNPILKDIANFFNSEVGQLDNSNVNGDNVVDKINTLNSLINQVQGLTILNGESNPNVTPPLFYNVGDFYIQSVSSLVLGYFVFSGTEWVSLQNWINDSVVSDSVTWSSQKIVDYINNKNELISTNGYLLTDSSITFYAGARWRINNTIYTNQNDITIPVPIASPGNYRTDLYVGNESGLIVRISGTESTTIQAAPNLPTNTVAITESTTYGDSTAIQPAPDLDGLKSKLESGIVYFNDSGVIDNFNLVGQESHLYINGATELKSVQIANGWRPYDGKQLVITNNSTVNITLNNNASGTDIYAPFIFTTGTNYVLKPKESIVFYYSISDGKFYFLSTNIDTGGTNVNKRTYICTFQISQNIAASVNWYANTTLSQNIYNAQLTSNATLTPVNDFANTSVQYPCFIVPFNCRIKSVQTRGFSNSGATDVRICILKSETLNVSPYGIYNNKIICDKTFNTHNWSPSNFYAVATNSELSLDTVINKGSEIRLFLFNNNKVSNLFTTVVNVEFEEIL